MLTGLKVSSLTCKCVLYGLEQMKKEDSMELSFEGLETQKWNIPAGRAQRLDEKNGVICLVILFTPRAIIIKMTQIGLFFVFSADESKKSVTV